MTWLTWRQFRADALVALAVVTAVVVGFAVTGPHLAALYATSGLPGCATAGTCETLRGAFLTQVAADTTYPALFFAGLAVLHLAPAMIGMFWGAPLITRELEARTLRLAWSQSVTRTRWLTVKLVLIGAVAMAAAGILSTAITWWAGPIDRADALPGHGQALPGRFDPIAFGARDVAPVGWAALAFVIGVTAGVLVRRTLPAMAATLVAVAALQLLTPTLVRPHLLPVAQVTVAEYDTGSVQLRITGDRMTIYSPVNIPGAWIISNETVTAAGTPFTGPPPAACRDDEGMDACVAAIGGLHPYQHVTYQPADRYWTFQWLETALVLTLAVALAGLTAWRVRRLAIV
jgi:hypothetical protein